MAGLDAIGIRISAGLEKKPLPLPSWEGVGGRGRLEEATNLRSLSVRSPLPPTPSLKGRGRRLAIAEPYPDTDAADPPAARAA